MSKYNKYEYRQVRERRWKVHPVWRGIGIVLAIMVPVMSVAGGILLTRANLQNNWVKVPAELEGYVSMPEMVTVVMPELDKLYYLDLALAFTLMIIGFGILTIFYSMMYRAIGPSRYGPVDSPPIRYSPKRGLGRKR